MPVESMLCKSLLCKHGKPMRRGDGERNGGVQKGMQWGMYQGVWNEPGGRSFLHSAWNGVWSECPPRLCWLITPVKQICLHEAVVGTGQNPHITVLGRLWSRSSVHRTMQNLSPKGFGLGLGERWTDLSLVANVALEWAKANDAGLFNTVADTQVNISFLVDHAMLTNDEFAKPGSLPYVLQLYIVKGYVP